MVYIKPRFANISRMNIDKQLELAKKTGCLCLSNMNLRFLPKIPDYVQELHCDNNKLYALPSLPASLRRLSCNNNFLKSLPKLPKSLLFLYCSNNKLLWLPSLPKNLLELDCSVNRLRQLSKIPSQLYFLHVSQNILKHLPVLPDSLYTPSVFEADTYYESNKSAYIVFHNNAWNPLFEKYLSKGIKIGVNAYHLDINTRLKNLAALQTINALNADILACVGSFLSGSDGHTVKQTRCLLDMIE